MICTTPEASVQTDLLPRSARGLDDRLAQQADPSEYPLLDWLAGELQDADGLDNPAAVRAARRLLQQALASVDSVAMRITHLNTPHTETTQ